MKKQTVRRKLTNQIPIDIIQCLSSCLRSYWQFDVLVFGILAYCPITDYHPIQCFALPLARLLQ